MVLSPFGFCGSRRQWVVNPRTRVSGARAVEDNQPSRILEPLEPETRKGNRPPCLQKPLEPETIKGNRPPCLQKFLDLEPSRATGPRDYNKSFCPRPQRATGPRVYKSSSKTGPPGDNQSHGNPDLPVSFNKNELPFKACTAKPRFITWDLRRQPAIMSAQKLQLSWKVKQQQDARHLSSD